MPYDPQRIKRIQQFIDQLLQEAVNPPQPPAPPSFSSPAPSPTPSPSPFPAAPPSDYELFRRSREALRERQEEAPGVSPGASLPAPQPTAQGQEPSFDPLMPGGFGQPAQVDGFWAKVWQGISNTLTIFDPLLLPGDVAKSFIYGLADGGVGRGLELAGKQLREWTSYLPGGERVKQLVSGEELARKLIDGFDEMGGAKKFAVSLAMDLVTDPLSVFGIAALAAKGTGVAARGVAKVPGLKPAAALDRPLTAAAQALERADQAVQQVLNPFVQAGTALGWASRLPLPFKGEAVAVGEVAGRVLDSILNIRLKRAMVDSPGGVRRETYITLGNFIFPHGSTREEAENIFAKLPRYTGSPETGPGSVIRARATYQEYQQRALAHVEDAARLLHDAFGETRGMFKRKVLREDLLPFVSELTETAGAIISRVGLADAPTELQKAAVAVRNLARGYGVDEDLAESVFRQYHDRLRLAYLEAAHTFTGMPLYEKVYKERAAAAGLDPEEAWTRYLGLRAGSVVPVKEGDRWVYRPTEAPMFIQEVVLPRNPRSQEAFQRLKEGKVAPGTEVRTFLTLNAFDQMKALEEMPQLGGLLEEYRKAAEIAQNTDFQKQVLGQVDQYIAQMSEALGGGEEVLRQGLDRLLAKQNPYEFWRALDDFAMEAGGLAGNLLSSPDKKVRAVGMAMVGEFLEATGRIEEALVFYGRAAKDLPNREAARFAYALGAPRIGVPQEKAVRVSLFSREDLQALRNATSVEGRVVGAVVRALGRTGAGVVDEVRQIAEAGPYRDLVLGVLDRNPDRLTNFARDVLTGKLPSDAEGAAAAVSILRQLGLEGELVSVMQVAGKTDSLEKFRANFASNLLAVEKEAIEEFYRQKPAWMGAMSAADLLGAEEGGRWRGNPFSPLQWFADVKNGYARKIYSGVVAPESTMGALLRGVITLVPEMDPDEALKRAGEWMRANNLTDPKVSAAVGKVVEYVKSAGDRFAFSTNSLIRLLKAEGVNLGDAELRGLLNYVVLGDMTSSEAIKRIGERLTAGTFSTPRAQMIPGVFRKRVPGTEFLVSFFDPGATFTEFSRYASRNAMAYQVLEELHNDLRAAGMIFDDASVDPTLVAQMKMVRVPESVVDMGDGAKTLAYGPLSGKWIPGAVWDDLVKTLAADPLSRNETLAAFLSFWRKALLNNHTTALVNIIGNEYLTWANMGPTFAMESYSQLIPAMRIYNRFLATGELPKEVSAGALHFLRETSLNQEVRQALSDRLSLFLGEDVTKHREGILLRLIQNVDRYANELHKVFSDSPTTPLRFLMGIEVFSYMENVKRLANYLAAKKLGMKEPEAMWAAAQATYNYGELPYGIQMVRNTGLAAFPSFAYFTIKAAAKWATERPAALTFPQRVSQASFAQLEPDEQARANVYMADWLRQSLPLVLPFKRPDGSYVAIPLSSLFPIRPGSTEIFEEVVAGGVYKPFIEAAWGLIKWTDDPASAGYPVFSAKFGDVLFREAASGKEAVMGTLSYVGRQFLPTWLSRQTPFIDAPLLLAGAAGNPEAYAELRTLSGRWIAQYTNPVVVGELERRLGRTIGMTSEELAVSLLNRPRPVPQNPLAPGGRGEVKEIQRELAKLQEAMRERVMRGESIDDLRPRAEVLMERLRKELAPYLEVIERFGPPPEMPPLEAP